MLKRKMYLQNQNTPIDRLDHLAKQLRDEVVWGDSENSGRTASKRKLRVSTKQCTQFTSSLRLPRR